MLGWGNPSNLPSRSYAYGHCGERVASVQGWSGAGSFPNLPHGNVFVYICHHCGGPTFFPPTGQQIPGAGHGETVKEVTDKAVDDLYQEARRSTAANAYTAAVLCCRKLLMHIAVSKGAATDLNFAAYVKYLIDNHYVPPGSDGWVDHIRQKGNEANHEVVIMGEKDAELLLTYCGMLLKMLYEFPATLQKATSPIQSA
jgi:Domain of unknown function (DUF4145)